MNIREIIDSHYNELLDDCNCDKVLSQGKTECDVLQDAVITTMRRFKEKDITEEEGLGYLKKRFYTEKHFQKQRQNIDILTFVDNIEDLGV